MDFILDKVNNIIIRTLDDLYKFFNIFFRPNLSENITLINNLKPFWIILLPK